MSSADEIARAFIQHYYVTFDSNRSNLQQLYQEQSVLTWEGNMINGQQAIIERLNSLPTVTHDMQTMTVDVQPTISSNALLIFVAGKLKIDNGNALQFTQVFELVSMGSSYYVHNDIFRLNYA